MLRKYSCYGNTCIIPADTNSIQRGEKMLLPAEGVRSKESKVCFFLQSIQLLNRQRDKPEFINGSMPKWLHYLILEDIIKIYSFLFETRLLFHSF